MEEIIKRRIIAREAAIKKAKSFVECVGAYLSVRKAILIGSYARGDFNISSDIDILIVVDDDLPNNPIKRLDLVETCLFKHINIEPIIINVSEYNKLKDKRNPVIVEAEKYGIQLI